MAKRWYILFGHPAQWEPLWIDWWSENQPWFEYSKYVLTFSPLYGIPSHPWPPLLDVLALLRASKLKGTLLCSATPPQCTPARLLRVAEFCWRLWETKKRHWLGNTSQGWETGVVPHDGAVIWCSLRLRINLTYPAKNATASLLALWLVSRFHVSDETTVKYTLPRSTPSHTLRCKNRSIKGSSLLCQDSRYGQPQSEWNNYHSVTEVSKIGTL